MVQKNILNKYPKKRIDLPPEYQKIYDTHYFTNRNGEYKTTSVSQKLESWMHKKIARDVSTLDKKYSTLEIGAGTLNQLHYESAGEQYDIVEPFTVLFENSPLKKNIRTVYKDIGDIVGVTYDRITTVATFEHIMDLPFVVAKAAMLLKTGGHLRVAIPNEGTLMWWLGTQVTGFEFKKKYGLDYQTLMTYEHVNTADDIEAVLTYFFEKVECSVFGISKSLAFYRFYDCSMPRIDTVHAYFEKRDGK
jgi:SAM-dependent methyltransferase